METLYNVCVPIENIDGGAKKMSNGKVVDATLIIINRTILDQVIQQSFLED